MKSVHTIRLADLQLLSSNHSKQLPMADPFAYKRDKKLQERLSAEILQLLKIPGNGACADCDATRTVRFCSVTLGVFLCNRCYAIHRNVGAHVTRTKCVGLDTWHPDEIAKLRAVGNRRANAEFEAHVGDARKPTAASPDSEAERWIRDKYERRKFYRAAAAAAPAPAPAAAAPVDLLGGFDAFAAPAPAPALAAAGWASFAPAPAPAAPASWASFDAAPAPAPAVDLLSDLLAAPAASARAARRGARADARRGALSNDEIMRLFAQR